MTHAGAQRLQMLRRSSFFSTSASNNGLTIHVFIEMQKLQKLNRIASLISVFFFMNYEKDREKKEFLRGAIFSASYFCNICGTTNIPLVIAFIAAEVGAEVISAADADLLQGGLK